MCGFTGFFAKDSAASRTELHVTGQEMTRALLHRGPDDGGVWQDPDISMVLGHRRLSIIDLSEEGAQPMVSASGRYIIAYNGEVYNFPVLQKELAEAKVTFRGRSDTEVILAGIDYWGLSLTLQKLNGMFAFALWDRKTRELHLVRDRMGKKPVYVGWADKTLIFGSELKALRAHPDFAAEINRDALALYLRNACVPAPHSIYKGVWQLPAGHILTLDTQTLQGGENLAIRMKPYWHHLNALTESQHRKNQYNIEDTIEKFDALLTSCVRDRLVSDVPLGAFLSGGIDSSTIVALMQKISSQPVKTYAVGFKEDGFNEAPFAKQVAAHLGTDHHELYLGGQDILDVIPDLAEIYDEPFGDISAIPTHLVSKFARGDVTVALSGDGGDEMLGGYNRHFRGPQIWNRSKHIPAPLRRGMARMLEAVPTTRWDALFKNQPQFGTRMHKVAGLLSQNSEEEIYQRLTSQWEDAPVIGARRAIKTLLSQSDYAPEGLSFAEKMMYWDTLSYLPNDILTKVDRASMAVSLECRAPLLDRRIYEFVWSLPEEFKIRKTASGMQGKYLLRQVLNKYVPQDLFERPKQGFTMPVGEWLRGPLRNWAEDLLDEGTITQAGLLDSESIRNIWNEHQQGAGNHADALWSVLMFQSWHRKWMNA